MRETKNGIDHVFKRIPYSRRDEFTQCAWCRRLFASCEKNKKIWRYKLDTRKKVINLCNRCIGHVESLLKVAIVPLQADIVELEYKLWHALGGKYVNKDS